MVEPNIKEGKGGLRDLHVLGWMTRHCYGLRSTQDYIDAGVLSADEANTYRRSLEFLWKVRCHLHFVTGRAEERLTLVLQPDDQMIPAGKRIALMLMSSDRDFTLWPQRGTELTFDLDAITN